MMANSSLANIRCMLPCGPRSLNSGCRRAGKRECRRFKAMVFTRLVLIAGVVLLASSCTTATCSPASCEGCCSGGECLTGHSRFTCGSGGEACVACGPTEMCGGSGQCAPDPRLDQDSGALLCTCANGCCLPDGGCVAGTQREACGPANTRCRACEASERCELAGCTSATCAGCFDLSNVCQPGTTETACGTGAMLCLGCLPGQRCFDGGCVDAPCNVVTCAGGCCNIAQRCVTPPSQAACGLGGQLCQACVSGLTCKNGLCQ
jgi:hypothetical protein